MLDGRNVIPLSRSDARFRNWYQVRGELPAAIEPAPIELGSGGRVEVKTSRRSDWRQFSDYGNGIWIEDRKIGDKA
ncbi:MAG TPA: hypothetical protein VFO69_08935 [Allosphingosinicella sp.]|nr:hypothetical protein [Allosphingosinicella sp.]